MERILILNYEDITHPEAGGSEVFTHEIARRWVKWGNEVTLICAKYKGAEDRTEIDGVEVLRTGGRYTVYFKARKIYEEKFRGKVDIVVDEINTVPFFTTFYVKEPKIALIHQLAREIWFYEMPLPISVLGYFIEPRILRAYGQIPVVTVSKSSKESLIEIGIPEKSIYIVSEGVDHHRHKQTEEKYDDPCIGYVGRLKRYKRIDDIIKAMKHVTKELPDVRLVLAGRGDVKYMGELKRLTARLKLRGNVNFSGPVLEGEKVTLLGQIQVLVYTSVREGFGLPILEAATCGTPAIAYDIPGLRDAVINGRTGLLIPYGDIKALANAIVKMLTNGRLRRRLSENAYDWSLNFSWDKTATEFMDLIKNYAH